MLFDAFYLYDVNRNLFRPAFVGAAAGLSLLAAPASYRTPIALFFGVRSLEIAVRIGVNRHWLPKFEHADTILMNISSAQVLWVYGNALSILLCILSRPTFLRDIQLMPVMPDFLMNKVRIP